MAIDRINPFMPKIDLGQQPAFGAQPIRSPQPGFKGAQGVDPVFTKAVQGFSAKANPFASQKLGLEGAEQKYKNGLSLIGEGALGEEAIYTKNGRLGGEFNLIG